MLLCWILLGLSIFGLICFISIEAPYFLWLSVIVVRAYILHFLHKRRLVNLLDETVVKGICWTRDLDTFLYHMNNTRYVRELDFAKADFNIKTGLGSAIRQKGGSWMVGATTIRYRRYIKPFQRFQLTSKIIYWDEQNIYFENRFITQPNNFVNAISMCRVRVTNCNADEIIQELFEKVTKEQQENAADIESGIKGDKLALCKRPELSAELEKWIESNDISSNSLRV